MIATVRAEFSKLFSLISCRVLIAATLLIPPALALGMGLNILSTGVALTDGAAQGFEVAGFGQPLIIVLAAVHTGSEYQNGLLRSSLLATPSRIRLLVAKLLVIGITSSALAAVSVGLAVLLRRAVLGDVAPTTTPGDVILNLATVALNWLLIGLISAASTVLARSMLLPVIVLVPMVLGLGVALVSLLPCLRFAPDLAGLQLIARYPGLGLLDPAPGAVVMALWAGVLLVAAGLRHLRRDV